MGGSTRRIGPTSHSVSRMTGRKCGLYAPMPNQEATTRTIRAAMSNVNTPLTTNAATPPAPLPAAIRALHANPIEPVGRGR